MPMLALHPCEELLRAGLVPTVQVAAGRGGLYPGCCLLLEMLGTEGKLPKVCVSARQTRSVSRARKWAMTNRTLTATINAWPPLQSCP